MNPALADAWQKIGKDARKALADELPRLKSLCEPIDAGASAGDAGPDSGGEEESGLATDTTPAQEAVEKVIAAMDAAKTDAALSKIWKDTEQHIEFMPPELGAKIETALDRNRRRLAPAEQGTGALV